ncbi:MAG: BadF/BadG/BcrA/BcrD ATPase family protein [Vulcanimicrobiaceae bacterium]
MTEYYAGIDGGQSSTRAIVAGPDGRILGRGTAGPADEVGEGPGSSRLAGALEGALEEAVRAAGLPPRTRLAGVVAGISGYEGRVRGRPPALTAERTLLLHDAPIAHAGAFAFGPGVAVIAGTGSVVYACNARGEPVTLGGWGYLFGDDGSAFGLARAALREAMRDADSGVARGLQAMVLEHFGRESLREVTRAVYAGEIARDALAAFAQPLVRAAESGDERVAVLIRDGSMALAILSLYAAQHAGLGSTPAVACLGGFFDDATIRSGFAQALRALLPGARLTRPLHAPVVGALLLAYREAGIPVATIEEGPP